MVAGLNYFLTLQVKDEKGHTFVIDVTVWSRPWLEASNGVDEAWKVTKVSRTDA